MFLIYTYTLVFNDDYMKLMTILIKKSLTIVYDRQFLYKIYIFIIFYYKYKKKQRKNYDYFWNYPPPQFK